MSKKVEVLEKEEIFREFVFRIIRGKLRHELYDGSMSEPMTRLYFERGDSVAALVHELETDSFLFTEQFRFPTYEKGPGWILEIPAGIAEADENYSEAIRREITEEIGYQTTSSQKIASVYVSPGGCSERIHIFYVPVSEADFKSEGGGLIAEGENIRTLKIPASEAFAKIALGEIIDAKTVIAIQWWKTHMSKH